MFAEMDKPKQKEISREDSIRDYMFSHNITYNEAKKHLEEGQKTLFNFKKKPQFLS